MSNEPNNTEKTALGLSPFLTCVVAYVFSWVGGLVVLFMEKNDQFVRKCAAQAVILGAVAILVPMLIGFVPFFAGGVLRIIKNVFTIGYYVITVLCLINAQKGENYKIPVVDDFADRLLNAFK